MISFGGDVCHVKPRVLRIDAKTKYNWTRNTYIAKKNKIKFIYSLQNLH